LVATPRLHKRIGQLTDQGGLICVVEDPRSLTVEIAVDEQDVQGVASGQLIQLKARSLPVDCFEANVTRIAPCASGQPGQLQSRVVVYCSVENPDGRLKSGMTGYARIHRGRPAPGHRPG
jgi:multidrug efflux pump subunit AcrA (membrane-fusion protein)